MPSYAPFQDQGASAYDSNVVSELTKACVAFSVLVRSPHCLSGSLRAKTHWLRVILILGVYVKLRTNSRGADVPSRHLAVATIFRGKISSGEVRNLSLS